MHCMATKILPDAVNNSYTGIEINSLQRIDNIACNEVWAWHAYCSLEWAQPTGGDA